MPVDLARGRRFDLPIEPAGEVIRLVRKGAHVRGTHVQEVDRLLSRISRSPPEDRRTLAQQQGAIREGAQELQGRHGSTEAGSDQRDRESVVSHRQALRSGHGRRETQLTWRAIVVTTVVSLWQSNESSRLY